MDLFAASLTPLGSTPLVGPRTDEEAAVMAAKAEAERNQLAADAAVVGLIDELLAALEAQDDEVFEIRLDASLGQLDRATAPIRLVAVPTTVPLTGSVSSTAPPRSLSLGTPLESAA